MNSIKQSQSNDEAQFLIRTFFKQIGLGKIIHQINFKRYTPISPLMMIKWLMTTIFHVTVRNQTLISPPGRPVIF